MQVAARRHPWPLWLAGGLAGLALAFAVQAETLGASGGWLYDTFVDPVGRIFLSGIFCG